MSPTLLLWTGESIVLSFCVYIIHARHKPTLGNPRKCGQKRGSGLHMINMMYVSAEIKKAGGCCLRSEAELVVLLMPKDYGCLGFLPAFYSGWMVSSLHAAANLAAGQMAK